MRFPPNYPKVSQIGVRIACWLAFLWTTVFLTADETFLGKPPEEWTEAEALQVLSDSPWAHTITTTTQDSQCGYDNPVFPGLYSEEQAERMSSISPTPPAASVKPDGAEYVVRLVSVKQMQAAADRLISLDRKWARYSRGYGLEPGSKPTNIAERWYNPADEITIAVVLKHPGPDGASFLDYAFDKEKREFPGGGLYDVWPCAAVKTAEGQVTAVSIGMGSDSQGNLSALHLSFPSNANHGRHLVSHPNEKMLVRMILNQRVFETTFVVSPRDLLDGTERALHIPSTVDEPTRTSSP